MTEKQMFDYLVSFGFTKEGVAGLMGNLKAESNLNPKNLQNSYERKLGLSDNRYTEEVDNGTYTNFVHDSAGYGLAQWTYWSRKQELLNFAKEKNTSIGDCEMQLSFMCKELNGYKAVFDVLKSTTSIKEASDIVLTQYEKPANQSDEVKEKRAKYGQEIYDRCSNDTYSSTCNSSLVDYTLISPNKTSPRNKPIKKITIHHMAGNISIETCGNIFVNPTRKASSNYGIGSDGRIGLYVDESDRAWTSGNRENDNQAVTIEVANDVVGGIWHVSDKAMESLILLCVDICKRNGIEKLIYTGDKTGNLTMHKWFQATTCPGPYLESKFPYIADEVNKRLGVVEDKPEEKPDEETILYCVQAGAFKNRDNAEKLVSKLKAAGFDAIITTKIK